MIFPKQYKFESHGNNDFYTYNTCKTTTKYNKINSFSELPSANVSAYKVITVKAGSTLNATVPISGNPAPAATLMKGDREISGIFYLLL